MRNCRVMDTSLTRTFRLIYHKGPKTSVLLKEHLLFSIFRLIRPVNFTIGGFYASDSKRLEELFERSNGLLGKLFKLNSFI